MSRWLFLSMALLFGALILLFASCGDDEAAAPTTNTDPPPPVSILGEYQGIYAYTVGELTTEYSILWRFSDQNYWMWKAPGSQDTLCEPSGEYAHNIGPWTSEVVLTQLEEGCDGEAADAEMNPTGDFATRRSSDGQGTDSLIMTQWIGDVCKQIRLVPHE